MFIFKVKEREKEANLFSESTKNNKLPEPI